MIRMSEFAKLLERSARCSEKIIFLVDVGKEMASPFVENKTRFPLEVKLEIDSFINDVRFIS